VRNAFATIVHHKKLNPEKISQILGLQNLAFDRTEAYYKFDDNQKTSFDLPNVTTWLEFSPFCQTIINSYHPKKWECLADYPEDDLLEWVYNDYDEDENGIRWIHLCLH